MLSVSAALSGYNGSDRCGRNLYGYIKRSEFSDTSKIRRVFNWINLLREMEFKVTPDVVVAYLVATRQGYILNSFVGNDVKYEYREYVGSCDAYYNSNPGIFNIGEGSYYGAPVACCCDCAGGSCGSRNERKTFLFPKEMFKMAGDYLLRRVIRLVDIIYKTVASDDNLDVITMSVGQHLPAAVNNALEGFAGTVFSKSSINSITSSAKSLYASLMPKLTAAGASGWCGEEAALKKFPSLKWDPSRSCECAGGPHLADLPASSSARCGFNNLVNMYKTLAMLLASMVRDKSFVQIGDVREAFCLTSEMIIYVSAIMCNWDGAYKIALPNIFQVMNMVRKNDLLPNGTEVKNTVSRPETRVYEIANIWSHLTPAGAIALGDGLLSTSYGHTYALHADNWGAGINHSAVRTPDGVYRGIGQVLEKMYPNPNIVVYMFLREELSYQIQMEAQAKSMYKQAMSDANNPNKVGCDQCCGMAEPCVERVG